MGTRVPVPRRQPGHGLHQRIRLQGLGHVHLEARPISSPRVLRARIGCQRDGREPLVSRLRPRPHPLEQGMAVLAWKADVRHHHVRK
ncbi:conserved hypothetical protein, partial [Stigmatella aurantiaca DW4/3-1]